MRTVLYEIEFRSGTDVNIIKHHEELLVAAGYTANVDLDAMRITGEMTCTDDLLGLDGEEAIQRAIVEMI